jgi:hypothetical protein
MRPAITLLAGLLAALGTYTPLAGESLSVKENAGRYYAHANLSSGNSIGADFLGRYLPVSGSTIYSDEYIFVEVAFFGPAKQADFKHSQITLRINGTTFTPQTPGLVTLQGNFPEMIARPQVVLDGGVGQGQIEIGGTERKPRFPGDDPAHTPSRVPQTQTDPSNGQVVRAPVDPNRAVQEAELPEGSHSLPIAGYLYFAYEGKLKKVKHAELEYKGPLGSATLTLR